MVPDTPAYPKFSYDENARRCAPDDLLGQSRRTIRGTPVPQEQIDMIVRKISVELDLSPEDVLLDLPCGNGSLSHLLFDRCRGYLGIDVSDYLISVAQAHFQSLPDRRFQVGRAPECLAAIENPTTYNKVLIYAGIQYFTDDQVFHLLQSIRDRFINVRSIFIGNIPDRDRHALFYKLITPTAQELNDHETALGIWRTRSDFIQLAQRTGWNLRLSEMPAAFYASSYRFDALLTRL